MRASLLAIVPSLVLTWAAQGLAQPAPAASASGPPLSAGGLAPPPAVDAAPPDSAAPPPGGTTPESTEQNLARADREDSGRGLEFAWLNGEAGVMHLGLATFSDNHLLDPRDVRSKQTGFVTGVGAGVRLVFLTLGVRFRYAPLPDLKLWTLGLEGGIHAPFGALEPYGVVDLGYVSLNGFPGPSDGVKVSGFDARLGGGVDYYLTNLFSVGVNVSADLMLLQRSTSICANGSAPAAAGAPYSWFNQGYCSTGSSTAGGVTATAVGGLHF